MLSIASAAWSFGAAIVMFLVWNFYFERDSPEDAWVATNGRRS